MAKKDGTLKGLFEAVVGLNLADGTRVEPGEIVDGSLLPVWVGEQGLVVEIVGD